MKVPCADRLPAIVCGLSFLKPALTNIQFYNLTLIATALVLGAKFSLTEINRMWLAEKSISTFSHFLSDAKFCTDEMFDLYALHMLRVYKPESGFFIIDDTLKHHTKFCKWIHGVFVLFDHAANTRLKAACIVFLYYSDGALIKFPVNFRIFYKENADMPWQKRDRHPHKKKYSLAIEMIEWATVKMGFPKCTVLADSWYGIGPFVKELKRLGLGYVLEVRSNYNVKVACKVPKLTPTGKKAKNQNELISLPKYFKSIPTFKNCGFAADPDIGKKEKVLYQTKVDTIRLNSITGKHRVVQSYDPIAKKQKFLLTDQLTWEASKIITVYTFRWVIEEFFRNAKQLTDMEGATVRSKQGVTLSLGLVSWIDSLLHLENHKRGIAEKLPKGSLTIPSIVRQFQYENAVAVVEKIQKDDAFSMKWLGNWGKNIMRNRKQRKDLDMLEDLEGGNMKNAA
ncbi:MAG: transposase [bacterium]|nr:transposase [bacterium]